MFSLIPQKARAVELKTVTAEGPPRDPVTQLPPTHQEDKQKNQAEPERGLTQLTRGHVKYM